MLALALGLWLAAAPDAPLADEPAPDLAAEAETSTLRARLRSLEQQRPTLTRSYVALGVGGGVTGVGAAITVVDFFLVIFGADSSPGSGLPVAMRAGLITAGIGAVALLAGIVSLVVTRHERAPYDEKIAELQERLDRLEEARSHAPPPPREEPAPPPAPQPL